MFRIEITQMSKMIEWVNCGVFIKWNTKYNEDELELSTTT